MRIPIIAGNWKMNKTITEGIDLVKNIKNITMDTDVEVVVCTPFIALSNIKKEIEGTKLKLAAQNMHWEDNGAFTGEISPVMLKDLGIDYVIIGHSERRQYFNESNETVNKKIKSAIKYGINPIVCVGETLEEREAGNANDKIKTQIIEGLKDIKEEDMPNIVLAYEPIWAIGTGKTASSKDANDMISFIRNIIKDKYGVNISDKVRIQYGGSVKPSNVTDIMNQSDIDGALVGGASLKAEDFIDIVKF